jgi:hypothetical protein
MGLVLPLMVVVAVLQTPAVLTLIMVYPPLRRVIRVGALAVLETLQPALREPVIKELMPQTHKVVVVVVGARAV